MAIFGGWYVNKHFAWFKPQDLLLLLNKVEKHAFSLKMADHLPLVTSYLVTIETDHHWTCLKMRARDKGTPTKNISCWCFIL